MAARKKQLSYFEEQLLFELRAIRLAILDHSKNTGKWLSAVAIAAANPADNTVEVQKAIDELTANINTSSDTVEDAIETTKQPKES